MFKVGHAHGGLGKVKVENQTAFQVLYERELVVVVMMEVMMHDLTSVVAVSGQYVTVEEYIEAKYDLHIFKIGDFYRALM